MGRTATGGTETPDPLGGLGSLAGAILGSGGGAQMLDAVLGNDPTPTAAGNNILGSIFGGDDVNQSIAGEVSALSPQTEVKLLSWTDEAVAAILPEIDLIVNATSLGMKPGDARLVPANALKASHLVFDMVYRADGETPLLGDAKMAGAKVVDGLTLLLHQGAISFEHWFGGTAPLDAMREGLRNALKA